MTQVPMAKFAVGQDVHFILGSPLTVTKVEYKVFSKKNEYTLKLGADITIFCTEDVLCEEEKPEGENGG